MTRPTRLIRDPILGKLAELIAEHGWAVQGVFGDTRDSVFSYTVGLSERSLPEFWLGTLDPRQAQPILNNLARLALSRGRLPVDEPIDIEWSIPFRLRGPVDKQASEAFAAKALYGWEAVEVVQVLWADRQGRFPDEEGYDGEGFPQRLLPLEVGTTAAMTQPENPAPTTEVSVEMPAKVTETTEVAAAPEFAGDPTPDAATQATEVEPKE